MLWEAGNAQRSLLFGCGKFSVIEFEIIVSLHIPCPRANSVTWKILCVWREFGLYKSQKDSFSIGQKSISIVLGSFQLRRYFESIVSLQIPRSEQTACTEWSFVVGGNLSFTNLEKIFFFFLSDKINEYPTGALGRKRQVPWQKGINFFVYPEGTRPA